MTRLNIASSLLLSLTLIGCITDKDVGLETESSESSSESSASASGSDSQSGGSADDTGVISGTATDGGDDTGVISGTATDGGDDTGIISGTESASASATTGSESGTGFDTEQFDAQSYCENSGGTWDDATCDHYFCGTPNECAAVIPGCDCGPDANFVEEVGCVQSLECDPFEFDCGPALSCDAPSQYCDILIPGVPKAETEYDCIATPKSCTADYTCDCFADAGDFEGECSEGGDGGITITLIAP
ncbi:MAG: hypothetical protein ACE37F_23510 [Nannocystaceae bacterium]|nr:hypothetical protein [bacterium]